MKLLQCGLLYDLCRQASGYVRNSTRATNRCILLCKAWDRVDHTANRACCDADLARSVFLRQDLLDGVMMGSCGDQQDVNLGHLSARLGLRTAALLTSARLDVFLPGR